MKFSHLDEKGQVTMVDVSAKPEQYRQAVASGEIKLDHNTISLIQAEKIAKGNVLTTAQIAGIQAAKKTSDLIPLCHNLNLTKVAVEFDVLTEKIIVHSQVKSKGVTGVEMEALVAVSTALLTIYDMCKAVDKNMIFSNIKLISKEKSNSN